MQPYTTEEQKTDPVAVLAESELDLRRHAGSRRKHD
jgi:hypothetical protein